MEANEGLHAGAFGIAARKVNHAEGDIAGKDGHLWRVLCGACRLLHALPIGTQFGIGQLVLKGKVALATRRNATGHLSRFNSQGATAAAGVVEGAAGFGRATPAGCGQHGCGQGFFERCVAGVLAPTALEERLARAVGIEGGGFGVEVQEHGQVGLARVHARPLAVGVAQRVAQGVFHPQAGEVQALQRALAAADVDAEGVLRGEPRLPVHISCQRVEVLLVAVGAVHQLHQHPGGDAAVQVQAHGVLQRGLQNSHAAARGFQLGTGQQGSHFGGQQRLNATAAGQKQAASLFFGHQPSFRKGATGIFMPSRYLATVRRAH